MVEAVKAIKARIKDKSEHVQIIALELLDQCMQSNGIQLQMHVMKKVNSLSHTHTRAPSHSLSL